MNDVVMQPRSARRFYFLGRSYDAQRGVLRLDYRLEPGPQLSESFYFPVQPEGVRAPRQVAVDGLLDAIHWIAGMSYWKTACPAEIVFQLRAPDVWQAGFLRRLYEYGLAEFAHQNQLDLSSRLNFPAHVGAPPEQQPALNLNPTALVPIGGGKDSLVVLESLRAAGFSVQPAVVGQAPLIRQVVEAGGLSLLQVRRTLAPELRELNAAGAYNGHVPITALNSAVLSLLALRQGCSWLVFANERSADQPTRSDGLGAGVNHQYSKSLAFERDWRDYLHRYVGGPEYFSMLRPWRELAVCRSFTRMQTYHGVFSSCNRNFHLDGPRLAGDGAASRWCGHCPKCQFVFLALAPFMSVQALSDIFGANLLADPAQIEPFGELLGLHGERPFECIGEVAECRAAIAALSQRGEWREAAVVQAWASRLPADTPSLEELLKPGSEHCIPEAFSAVWQQL